MRAHQQQILLLACAIAWLSGCSVPPGNKYTYGYYSGRDRPASTQPDGYASRTGTHHVVSKGETLYSIAWQYGQDVRDVARWNNLNAPYTIFPQQTLRVTPPAATHASRAAPPRTVTRAPAKSSAPISSKPAVKTAKPAANIAKNISWQWPAKGKIINGYSAKDAGKKGLDIAGYAGQPIHAAADGSVVYSGSGLRGYGQLIIIKHDDTYFSAYAHNKRIHVREDQTVKKGQHIADMGDSEADRVMLHFEVRRNGKPVDPLRYLPR